MKAFTERQLLEAVPEDFYNEQFGLGEVGTVLLESGEKVETNLRMLQHCMFYLDFNRKYKVPINPNQLPAKDEVSTTDGNSNAKWLDNGLEQVCACTHHDRRLVSELGLSIVERVITAGYKRLEEYAVFHSIKDYTQIYFHPTMKEAREAMRKEVEAATTAEDQYNHIKTCNEVFLALLESDEFKANGLAILYKTGSVKKDKLFQANVALGFVTDVNADFMPRPILECLSEGNKTYYGLAAASREAATNLLFTGPPVQESERSNRLSFLLASSVQNFYHGVDCGSTVGYSVFLTEDNIDTWEGCYLFDDNNPTPVLLTAGNKEEFIGKRKLVRNPAGCCHEDRVGVCGVCAGRISEAFRDEWKAGHLASIESRGPMAEILISIKHFLKGEARDNYKLPDGLLSEFLTLSKDKLSIIYTGYPKGVESIKLSVKKKDTLSLTEIFGLGSLEKYDVASFAQLNDINFIVTYEGGVESVTIPLTVSDGLRSANFREEFLTWLQDNRKSVYEGSVGKLKATFFELPDTRIPFIRVPFRQYSMPDFNATINQFLKSYSKDSTQPGLLNFNSFGEACIYAYGLISTHLTIPMPIIHMMLYVQTANDPEGNDYYPAKHSNHVFFDTISNLTKARSLTAAFTAEGLAGTLRDIRTDTITDRCPSTNDASFIGVGGWKVTHSGN